MSKLYITYFAHGTTYDNEKGLFSGQNGVELSQTGIEQMDKLRELIENKEFDLVLTSDLKRGVQSAELTWPNLHIIQDKRLRECDVGELTGKQEELVDRFVNENGSNEKFPNGESLKEVEFRIKDFLDEFIKNYPDKHIAILSHKYTQLAIDVIIKKISWEDAIKNDWRSQIPKAWQPGWEYIYEK